MSSLRPLTLLVLVISLLAITVLSSASGKSPSAQDVDQFQALLADIPESDIHEVLHDWSNRFKDGVFHRDRTAIEAVHNENAAVATELVKLAKSKRAISNTTTSAIESTSTTGRSAPPPPPPPTTTSSTSASIRTSVVPPSSPSTTSILSTTTARSSTAVVAFSPSRTTLLLTTTLPGGSRSIITSTAVVNAAYTTLSTDTAVAAQTGTATGTPSLQTGGVDSPKNLLHGALFIAAGAIAIIFVQ